MRATSIAIHPATPKRWRDVEAVFNARGCSVARGCWCTFYRLSGASALPPKGSSDDAMWFGARSMYDRS